MRNYFVYFFHIVIISFFIGCGHKAAPVWPTKIKKESVTKDDLKILDINTTIKIK
jgi:hypothetical protein